MAITRPAEAVGAKDRLHDFAIFEDFESQPLILDLLHQIASRALVNQNLGPIGGPCARAAKAPLALVRKVAPGNGDGDQEFPPLLEVTTKTREGLEGLLSLGEDLEGAIRDEDGSVFPG